MKEEILIVENATIQKRDYMIYSELYLQLYIGEINGIIFDNILERRYLLDFFRGELLLNSGHIYLKEKQVSALTASRELKKMVRIIEKDSKLISPISIEENIFLFSDVTFFVSKRRYQTAFKDITEQFGVLKDVGRRVNDLSVKDRVIVELLKAYVEHKKIVILDNPTVFLKETELEEIYELLKKLCRKMAVLITIGFEEVGVKWMNRVMVMQNGKTIAVVRPEENINKIFQALLVKRKPLEVIKSTIGLEKSGKPGTVMEFKHVSTSYLRDLNFKIEMGEMLKICYIDEESRDHILSLLMGEMSPTSGTIYLKEKPYRVKNIYGAIKNGVCLIKESPYQSMLFDNMSVIENLSIPLDEKVRWYWQFRKYSKSVESFVQKYMENSVLKKKMQHQKGTTRQQIVYSKWLLYAPNVVLCLNPFADLDIYMRETTIEMLHQFQESGIAVIILTSNLHTIQKLEGDIIYVYQGAVVDENEMYQMVYKKR